VAPKRARVGIIGGAGYTGGELVRILLNHEGVELAFVQSRSQAGKPVHSVHRDLQGETDLVFSHDLEGVKDPSIDAVFLALAHGEARKFVADSGIAAQARVIDLSHDFRLAATAALGDRKFVYGLPELNREAIIEARNIANPGCFATAIQLALLPLARAGKLPRAAVTGITGATGAGQSLSPTSHFAFRANNIQAYKTLTHQHLGEVGETLTAASGGSARPKISFVPWRGDFTRGIFVSAIVESTMTAEEARRMYRDFYAGHPFVSVSEEPIDLKSVVNTNRAQIEVQGSGGDLAIHCAIDNLLKGASGQAVQNLNLMMGFPETQGLKLKGVMF
jgi:N-acetyl-gamma-glutamyl-phosphate reductase